MELKHIAAGLQTVTFKIADGSVFTGYGAVEATGDGEQEVIEVAGDDQILGEFVTEQTESLTLNFSALSFDVLQAITGTNYASSDDGIEIPTGTDSEQNPPYVEITAKSMAKMEDGTTAYLYKTWYKAQVRQPSISQSNGSEVTVEFEGRSYKTSTDIEGNALASARVALVRIGTN